jgi:hypothetical protein
VLATLLLLAAPLRELRRGDPGAAVLWAASLLIPFVALMPFVADRPQYSGYVARIADLMKPLLHIVLAWVLAEGLLVIRSAVRMPPRELPRVLVPVAAAGLIAATALLSVGDARAAASVYRPNGVRSIELSRNSDLRYAWADRIQALERAGPGVVLADVTLSYELAGLTGRQVVAVWTSHTPFQDEARDGALRRGDVMEALSPTVDELALAGILERYHVGFVMVDRDLDDDATWKAAAAQPLYQQIANGQSWALYRYARANLDSALGTPARKATAGRAAFIRVSSCCARGTVHISARGLATAAAFSTVVAAAPVVALLIPDGVPPDVYALSVDGEPGGTITVGRAFEAEHFAGVYQERDSDKDQWHQWVSVHGYSYSRGLAAYTTTAGAAASRPIDLPAGQYCLEVDVYEPGDGMPRTLGVEVARQSEEVAWAGARPAMTAITRQLSLSGGAQTLAYRDLSPSGVEVLVDRLVLWPASC